MMVSTPLLMPLHLLLVAKKSWLPIHRGPSTLSIKPYLTAPQTKTFFSLSQKRQRWCASFRFRVTCTREPLAILEMVGSHLWRYIIPCTCNSYPRSRHVEADAQVTLKALCLLHTTQCPGSNSRERKKEWLIPGLNL